MRILLEEIRRRELLLKAIDSVLDQKFIIAPGCRLKRGIVHEAVARSLGLVLNNVVCRAVKEQVVARGGKPYISRGNLYYRGLAEKPE